MPDFGRWTSNGGDPSLNEINRTDRFIEALSLERPVYSTDPEEAELAYLLAGWRDEARQKPMTGIVAPRDAVAALNRATSRNRTRAPLALIGSVAAAMLCLGGFGAAVYGAGPGDALYGMRSALFGEQVRRDVQVELASSELQQVQQLIDQGQWQEAQQKLQTLTTTVATVGDAEQKQELVTQWQELSVKVENRDPNATVPPDAPPPVLPEVTVTTTPEAGPSESTSPTSSPSETSTPGESTTPSSEPTSPATSTTAPSTETSSPTNTSEPSTPPSSATVTPSSPAVELPPTSQTTVVTTPAPTSVTTVPAPAVTTEPEPTVEPTTEPTLPPVTRTTTTTLPPVAIPPAEEPEPARGGAADGDQNEGSAPIIELPLLPGMGGHGNAQR
ncbi:hypothetical protein AFM11_01230 [Mycolicibacterium wolinskyi]|uniref:Anti-sigma-D factor RsdA sigma factor binding region domain-containing protein n=1 Tax=Mycolicibacterium wolinskyi TaxID=59750 RepID=A0A132PUE6_9MYCO|nr:anti-sigma-D factor RsdA [Mycolicibacterium wolinskyi]KWX25935.1 hypothetical protein AFM11_01230 [Mycolicibacterium wolinskyi]